MKLLVAYASTEGQTRKIARHVADRIADAHHAVELIALSEAEGIDLSRFDGAILAASIHIGGYQKALTEFAAALAGDLGNLPTLFLSVSLSAVGHDAADWTGLEDILRDFIGATGWTPGQVAQVGGAYVPSSYDIFRRFVMRRIIAAKDAEADLDADHEYTDWDRVDATVDDWMAPLET